MSFLNAGREIQRFIANKQYNTPVQESIMAVMAARALNSTIMEKADTEYEPGKLRQLKISYYPIRCDVVADSIPANICQDGTVAAPIQEWFSLADSTVSKTQKLRVSDIRLVDGNYTISDHAKMQINATMGALEVAFAKQLTTKIIAHKGLHLDGSEFGNRVSYSNTTNGIITPVGYWQVEKEQSDGAYNNFFTLGSTEVFNWKKAYAAATDNTTLGQDFRKVGIERLYYDINLNTIMGVDAGEPEYILTFDPEALKFVSFSHNAGIFTTNFTGPEDLDRAFKSGGLNQIRGAFFSPKYGILWDFNANFDPCDGEDGSWSWYMVLRWDIYFPKVQTCNVQGVNGIMLYKTCPVVLPVCPTGDTPSPSPSSRSFSWTPGSIYGSGLLVSDINVGGNVSKPNVLIHNIAELVALLNECYYGQAIFSVSGSNVHYTGYSAITGEINNSTIAITFA